MNPQSFVQIIQIVQSNAIVFNISMDGSQYFDSSAIHCEHCLGRQRADGTTSYHHHELQATLVHPDKSQVVPLAPEFIRNSDGHPKQDCEFRRPLGLSYSLPMEDISLNLVSRSRLMCRLRIL